MKAALSVLKDYATPVSMLILASVMLYDHLTPMVVPAPAPVVNVDAEFLKLGDTYRNAMASAYGDAWLTAADSLSKGSTVAVAQKALQDKWEADRKASFASSVTPTLEKVLAAGTEPSDAQHRALVVRAWSAFGRGLKGGTR